MTNQFLIESGKNTCENDMLELAELLSILEIKYNFRFCRISPNKIVKIIDK